MQDSCYTTYVYTNKHSYAHTCKHTDMYTITHTNIAYFVIVHTLRCVAVCCSSRSDYDYSVRLICVYERDRETGLSSCSVGIL